MTNIDSLVDNFITDQKSDDVNILGEPITTNSPENTEANIIIEDGDTSAGITHTTDKTIDTVLMYNSGGSSTDINISYPISGNEIQEPQNPFSLSANSGSRIDLNINVDQIKFTGSNSNNITIKIIEK